MKIAYNLMTTIVLMGLTIFLLSLSVAQAGIPEPVTITYGQNITFTEMNHHVTRWSGNADSFSEGNTARVLVEIKDEGEQEGGNGVGLFFKWDFAGYDLETIKNEKVQITINLSYKIKTDKPAGITNQSPHAYLEFLSCGRVSYLAMTPNQYSGGYEDANTPNLSMIFPMGDLVDGSKLKCVFLFYVHGWAYGWYPSSAFAEVIVHSIAFNFQETPNVKIPLGKGATGTDNNTLYRIYVPSRYGGTLTVSTDAGVIELFYPDPSTRIAGPDTSITYSIPFRDLDGNLADEHGWYYVKHFGTTPFNISNTFEEKGEAVYRPWNFWYYPFAPNPLQPEKNLHYKNGTLAKYDAVFTTGARDYELKNNSSGAGWEGHCLGGSIASILVPEPQALTYAGQYFNQEEAEGLVTKLANTKNEIGLALVSGIPSWRKEINGTITPIRPIPGPDETDKFVSRFHASLINSLHVPQSPAPLYSNLRQKSNLGLITGIDPEQVWNHAVYKYSSFLEESDGGNENIVKLTTATFANSDMFPSDTDIDRVDVYVYKLKYNNSGEIDWGFSGTDWISATGFAPEQLTSIYSCAFDNNLQIYDPDIARNTYVTKENVETLGMRLSR